MPSISLYCENYRFTSKKLPNSIIEIKYWDTIGQEQYRALCTLPIKKADIIIFVRDKENDNLEGEDGWIKFVEENSKIELPEKKLIFCLNKTDLLNEEEKKDIYEDLLNIAQTENLNGEVYLISSKNSDNILTLQSHIKQFAVNIILNEINKHKQEINICFFGQSMVGKSSLINRIIKDEFIESTIATLKLIKKEYHYVDLKNHFDIKFNYYDIPGQEKYMEENIDILKKIDIIIFVNEKDNLKINYELIEKKITLLNKKMIFCINKADLLIDGIKETVRKNYLKNNNKEPFFISALSGEGIKEFKENLIKIGNEVIKERNINKKEESSNSVSRAAVESFNLDVKNVSQKNTSCWDQIIKYFSYYFNI